MQAPTLEASQHFEDSLKPSSAPQPTTALARQQLRLRVDQVQQAHPGQLAGTRWAMGCVSLEVTQRCNLDCTACYLSDDAELVPDFPLQELLRRVHLIHAHYGAGTDIQISGGEPTLRPLPDLIKVVGEIRALGMRCSLFTNGIKASRELLTQLAQAGLNDVAFHVDITQDRRIANKMVEKESELMALRAEYIERATGLGLNIFFNTTVVERNFHDVPMLVRYFAHENTQVSFASFQMQADTGRGVLRNRPGLITQASVLAQIQTGLGANLDFDALLPGHGDCNRYATALLVGPKAYDAFAAKATVQRFFRASSAWQFNRRSWRQALLSVLKGITHTPKAILPAVSWLAQSAWQLRTHWAALALRRQKLRKISFLVHNFMDAKALNLERTHACVFMAISENGPLSMCAYNAQRDQYLRVGPEAKSAVYQPLKFLKGRQREHFLAQRTFAKEAVRAA